MQVLFDAFYFVLSAVHDCDLHTQDAFPGTPSDTHAPDECPATAYCVLVAMNDTLSFSLLLSYWSNFVGNFDML
jgi:hypothetical protein